MKPMFFHIKILQNSSTNCNYGLLITNSICSEIFYTALPARVCHVNKTSKPTSMLEQSSRLRLIR